jgi:vancomycin aglycone glucosyltransferase
VRIVLAPEGTTGDVHPLLALGERLLAAGHQVLVCAAPDFEAEAARRSLAFRPVGRSVREYLAARAAAVERGGLRMAIQGSRYVRDHLPVQFEAMGEAVAGADLVVGAGLQLAAGSAAEARGIPYRYILYCPALLPSREHPPIVFSRASLPGWAMPLAWRAGQAFLSAGLRGLLTRQRACLGLPPVHDPFLHLLSPRPILAADEDLAPLGTPPRGAPAVAVERMPCLHPTGGDALPAKLEAFLGQGEAPVYLGFGSMTDARPDRTTRELLRACSGVGRRAILGRGWAGIGEGALPEGVFVAGPVSHARLFPHCAAVVHHGGAGTTTTAARAGVPQVIVPHVFDQFYWGRRVRELGIGLALPSRRGLRAEPLAEALGELLDQEVVTERARELGTRLRARAEACDPVRTVLAPA